MLELVGFGTVNWPFIGSQNLGLVRYLKSGDGDLGRVARLGTDIGSGGIGGEGRDGLGSGDMSRKCGAAVTESDDIRFEVEDSLRDRAACVSIWRASGEGCA